MRPDFFSDNKTNETRVFFLPHSVLSSAFLCASLHWFKENSIHSRTPVEQVRAVRFYVTEKQNSVFVYIE